MLFIAAVDVVAIIALHSLGPAPPWDEVPAWLARAPIEQLLALSARWIALAIAYWIALSLAMALLAARGNLRSLAPAAERLALPVLRPVVRRVLVVALAAAPAASMAPAWANSPPPSTPIEVLPPYVPQPAGLPEDAAITEQPLESFRLARPAIRATYVVRPGDNLWRIACRYLASRTGNPNPTSAQIIPYWRQLIDLNRDRLRSGDPDLIYAGEELLLPNT